MIAYMSVGSQRGGGHHHFDSLRRRIELLISGSPPSDPLYLTNRTWQQKLKFGSLIVVPVLLLIALVAAGATYRFRSSQVDPFQFSPGDDRAPDPAPRASARRKASLDPVIASPDLDVVNIRITRDGHSPMVTGMVRNKSGRKIESAEISYYLADRAGNLVGVDRATVANLGPHGGAMFRMPLKSATAEYVFARDAHPN